MPPHLKPVKAAFCVDHFDSLKSRKVTNKANWYYGSIETVLIEAITTRTTIQQQKYGQDGLNCQ